MNYRSPVKRARGLGSAKDGVAHWWAQRVTAIVLIPLGLWFAVTMIHMLGADAATASAWLASPWHTALLVLFMATMVYHSFLGLQVVVEDYVHTEWRKLTTLLLLKFLHYLIGAVMIIAVLRIALGGLH